MKMIVTDETASTSSCELDLNGRHSMPVIAGSKKESATVKMKTVVVVDSYEQRESLQKFLVKKKYKMSNGMFGTQGDFAVGSDNLSGDWRQTVTLQIEDPDKHEWMRQDVKEWAHKINSQKRKIPA